MRIIAFDISASPGVAVIEIRKGIPKLLCADSVNTKSKSPDSQRFAYVEAFAVKAIHEYGPFDVIIREHFVKGGSKRSTQMVFGSWAAIDMALGKYGYNEIAYEPTPTTVKKIIGGHGKAEKDEVEAGVRRIMKLPDNYEFVSNDASDAAAIGLTYLIEKGVITT